MDGVPFRGGNQRSVLRILLLDRPQGPNLGARAAIGLLSSKDGSWRHHHRADVRPCERPVLHCAASLTCTSAPRPGPTHYALEHMTSDTAARDMPRNSCRACPSRHGPSIFTNNTQQNGTPFHSRGLGEDAGISGSDVPHTRHDRRTEWLDQATAGRPRTQRPPSRAGHQ